MAKLKLFGKKKGGTRLGNLIRKVAPSILNVVAPGAGTVVGNALNSMYEAGQKKLEMEESGIVVDKDNNPVTERLGELTGNALGGLAGSNYVKNKDNDGKVNINSAFTDGLDKGLNETAKPLAAIDYIKKYALYVIGSIVLIFVLIFSLRKK